MKKSVKKNGVKPFTKSVNIIGKEAIRIFAKREDNVSIIGRQAEPEKENEENKD